MPEIDKLTAEIKLLKKDITQSEAIHVRLDTAIEKLTELAVNIKSMLAVHESKIARAEQVDDDIFVLLESRRKEWDEDLKELHSRITTNTRELREHTISSEKRLLNEMRAIRGELSNRVGILEKWRWIIIGGAIVVGLIFTDARDSILDLFN
jgi:chromosome segregation ATPase